jgi:hypothetical protein
MDSMTTVSKEEYANIMCVCIAFVKVKHEQRLKNIDGDFLIMECQTGECSAVCTRASSWCCPTKKV